ncbi:hypothetical protein [Streptomyces prunicolor]|uniref:hypothetical protein n=1 Tax=Streptomyces prunicolor TaxID=67348 RepID=UPI0033ED38B9
MTELTPPPLTEHTIAYEHPHGVRRGGVVAISQYRTPPDPDTGPRRGTTSVVRYVDTVPENATGRGAAPLLAQLLDRLPEAVPIRLFLGLTFGGRELADAVIVPELHRVRAAAARAAEDQGDDDATARAWRRVSVTTYAVDVGPAAASVERTITVHRRLAAVATGLELGELKIPVDLPRADDLRRAIGSYNPTRRVTADGRDEWGVDPYEGVLVALTVAYTEGQTGHARVHAPLARRSLPGHGTSTSTPPGRSAPPWWSRRLG